MRHSWYWPTIILFSVIATWIATAMAPAASAERVALVMWFLFVCPGMAYIRFLRTGNDVIVEWTMGVALSFSIDSIVGGIFLYAGKWSPTDILYTLFVISCAGAVMQLIVQPQPVQDENLLEQEEIEELDTVQIASVGLAGSGIASDLIETHLAASNLKTANERVRQEKYLVEEPEKIGMQPLASSTSRKNEKYQIEAMLTEQETTPITSMAQPPSLERPQAIEGLETMIMKIPDEVSRSNNGNAKSHHVGQPDSVTAREDQANKHLSPNQQHIEGMETMIMGIPKNAFSTSNTKQDEASKSSHSTQPANPDRAVAKEKSANKPLSPNQQHIEGMETMIMRMPDTSIPAGKDAIQKPNQPANKPLSSNQQHIEGMETMIMRMPDTSIPAGKDTLAKSSHSNPDKVVAKEEPANKPLSSNQQHIEGMDTMIMRMPDTSIPAGKDALAKSSHSNQPANPDKDSAKTNRQTDHKESEAQLDFPAASIPVVKKPTAKPESRPVQAERPVAPSRPAEPKPESRPAASARPIEPRPEPRPVQVERPVAPSRPAEPKPEPRPATSARPIEPRPEPRPVQAERPVAPNRPAEPKPESRPAASARPVEPRPEPRPVQAERPVAPNRPVEPKPESQTPLAGRTAPKPPDFSNAKTELRAPRPERISPSKPSEPKLESQTTQTGSPEADRATVARQTNKSDLPEVDTSSDKRDIISKPSQSQGKPSTNNASIPGRPRKLTIQNDTTTASGNDQTEIARKEKDATAIPPRAPRLNNEQTVRQTPSTSNQRMPTEARREGNITREADTKEKQLVTNKTGNTDTEKNTQ